MDEDWERRLLSQQLRVELGRLPDHYRKVVVLRYLHEFSTADVAVILDTSESRVRTLAHRAMTKLRDNWEQGGELPCQIDSKSLPL
jgi:RNA polymerase sigma-70 factor (ECF subfamily)